MKVLLLGAGAVGESYALLTHSADPEGRWLEKLVVADFSEERAQSVAAKLGGGDRFPHAGVDATSQSQIEAAIRAHGVDLLINGCPQHLNREIFEACFQAGCHYLDMAMTLSEKHPSEPYKQVGTLLGDYQFAKDREWKEKGRLALLGMGIDPGVSEVLAKYAEEELFDEIDEIGVRDGANMTVEGHRFATQFSVWSVIEECLNPPVFWEKDRGYYTGQPMSRAEVFDFPEVGPLEVVAIEHEEVINLPRWINKGLKKVDFKICLGDELMDLLKTIDDLGLSSAEPINVKGVMVAPRDVVEAVSPDPYSIGPKMVGKICVGVNVVGRKDGRDRTVYLYQVSDNQECMKRWGCQAVAVQTAVGPAIATQLLAEGKWRGAGVVPPEAFDPRPFMALMSDYGFPYGIRDSWTA
jgi:saccharopine dehydrogenase-like NADP-dependent oxidoreductase